MKNTPNGCFSQYLSRHGYEMRRATLSPPRHMSLPYQSFTLLSLGCGPMTLVTWFLSATRSQALCSYSWCINPHRQANQHRLCLNYPAPSHWFQGYKRFALSPCAFSQQNINSKRIMALSSFRLFYKRPKGLSHGGTGSCLFDAVPLNTPLRYPSLEHTM